MAGSGARLAHVRRVGARAEFIARVLGLGGHVVDAAWLHDVGYAAVAAETGFHPLDGATWLASRAWTPAIVSLVAFHSGAVVEAEERGLRDQLQQFVEPDAGELDALNFCDMTTGPDGSPVAVEERIAEILSRYNEHDPVHRAVLRSRAELVQSVRRVEARLASADVDLSVVT